MRKKLFAILMSAMMMVTFMPAMAFAETAPVSAKFVSKTTAYDTLEVTYDGETASIPTIRKMNDGTVWTDYAGMIEAYVDLSVVEDYFDDHQFVNEKILKDEAKLYIEGFWNQDGTKHTQRFYDLTGAKITGIPSEILWANSGDYFEISNGAYVAKKAKAGVELAVPTYVVNYDAKNYKTQVAAKNFFAAREVTFGVTGFDSKVKTAQNVTVTVTLSAPTPTTSETAYVGAAPSKAVLVKAKALGQYDVEFYVDEVNTENLYGNNAARTFDYDGATHTIVNSTVDGVTVTYKKWDAAANAYATVDAVTFKDAASATYYKAVLTKANCQDVEVQFIITVDQAGAPKFEFDKNDATDATPTVFDVEEGFDALKYIVVKAANTPAPAEEEKADKEVREAKNAANKKATAADEALLLEYFNDYFTVVQTPAKYEATKIKAEIKAKTLTSAEKATLAAKYKKTVANNFATPVLGENTKVTFNVTAGGDIDWVKAPLTKKYHNKKGTLKKTYTFAVEAKAATKVTYKLTNGGEMIKIDKNTGKVTVKKGLKVGTYKVYVTANAGSASDTYAMTIKMAKK